MSEHVLDDRQFDYTIFSDVCEQCAHFNREYSEEMFPKCAAFPDGIPLEIWDGLNTHRKPYPSDHGVQFKPKRIP